MEQKKVKCDVCGFETTYSKRCLDCSQLTQAYHKWLKQCLKSRRKDAKQGELYGSMTRMERRLEKIGTKTLNEWGL